MSVKRGLFITVEGTDGAGKSTQIAHISELLNTRSIAHILTREPGGTGLGEAIRDVLLTRSDLDIDPHAQLLLVFAARAQHIGEVIEPALSQGKWVVCDRFTDATYAYQGGAGGLGFEAVSEIEDWVQGELRPDLTLLLDVPVEIGHARTGARGGQCDRFESMEIEKKHKIRQAYLELEKRYPERIQLIDAGQDVQTVSEAIETAIVNTGAAGLGKSDSG